MVLGGIVAGHVQADPADDALAKLNELSRQAEQTTEAMHSAQLDLNNKLAVLQAADAKHTADAAAVESAKSQLATFQTSVDKLAAAQYMGGRTDGMDAMLTATSPQGLIDQLAVQRVMAAEMSAQMKSYRDIGRQAALAEQASAKSAADAKTAAEQAAAVRADLQSKQSRLQVQIAVVKSRYQALTPAQRNTLAALPPVPAPPVPATPPVPPIPAPPPVPPPAAEPAMPPVPAALPPVPAAPLPAVPPRPPAALVPAPPPAPGVPVPDVDEQLATSSHAASHLPGMRPIS